MAAALCEVVPIRSPSMACARSRRDEMLRLASLQRTSAKGDARSPPPAHDNPCLQAYPAESVVKGH